MQTPAAPQNIDKLLETGFRLFKAGFRDILGILLTQTISMILLSVFMFILTISIFDVTSTNLIQANFISSVIFSSLIVLTVELGFIAAFTSKFWAIIHHTNITSLHAYKVGIHKAFPLMIWMLIYLLLTTLGLTLLVVPGVILMVALFFGTALIIQDHYTPVEAIKSSYKLVKPHLQRTLIYLALTILITLSIYFATIFPLGWLISYITNINPMLNGIIELARYILIVLLVPLFVALIIPYYMDLQIRQKHADSV